MATDARDTSQNLISLFFLFTDEPNGIKKY